MTEADRVRAWRDKKRGGPPRPYHKRRKGPLLSNPRAEGQRLAWLNPDIRARRSAAIARAQDDPLHRAVMRRITLENQNLRRSKRRP